MRIALATSSLSPQAGANTGQNMLARQLRGAGHEVTQWRIARTTESTVFVTRLGSDVKREGRTMLIPGEDVRAWADLWGDNDVVHVTNPGVMGRDFKDAIDKTVGPLVLSVHDPYEFHALRRALVEWMRRAGKVMFIGEPFMRWVRRCQFLPDDEFDRKARHTPQPYVRACPSDFAFDRARPGRAVCTSPWRWNKNIPLIVEAAGLLPGDVTVAFHSANRNSDVEHLAGQTEGWHRCEDHDEAWSWPEAAFSIYGGASVLVDLVYFDGNDVGRTEYPILEAWDFGCVPVVLKGFAGPASERGELLHGRNCYVVDPDPESVAAGIVRGIETPVPDMAAAFEESLEPHGTAWIGFQLAYEEACEEHAGD